MTDRRIPTHLAVLVGVSAGAYAISLAGVTSLQSAADVRLTAERQPSHRAAEQVARDVDALERAAAAAAGRYADLADRYAQVGIDIGDTEAALDSLATRAASLTESAATLRVTEFTLPRVAPSVTRSTSTPRTHATTAASGG